MLIVQETEADIYKRLTQLFPRYREQVNGVNEADAEMIVLPGSETVMAVTTDVICEEIEYGIYDDPYLMGWMTVAVNISDLYAVGARPQYILLNEIFKRNSSDDFISSVQKGIADACKAFQVFVLGGDTNFSDKIVLGATAIGFIENRQLCVKRTGSVNGDRLFVSGPLGTGNFFGFNKLSRSGIDIPFQPHPKLPYAGLVGKYASACIDTSDGFFHALHLLIGLNDAGAVLNESLYETIPQEMRKICTAMNIHHAALLAGILGEYELLFTIPEANVMPFMEEAQQYGLHPFNVGNITATGGVTLCERGGDRQIDTNKICSLFTACEGDFSRYIYSLRNLFN